MEDVFHSILQCESIDERLEFLDEVIKVDSLLENEDDISLVLRVLVDRDYGARTYGHESLSSTAKGDIDGPPGAITHMLITGSNHGDCYLLVGKAIVSFAVLYLLQSFIPLMRGDVAWSELESPLLQELPDRLLIIHVSLFH